MSIEVGDVAHFPLHVRPGLGIGLLHPRDDAFADVHVDDGLDASIVNVGGKSRVAASDVEQRVLGSDVLVDNAA